MVDKEADAAEADVPRIDIQSRIAAFSQKAPPQQKPSAKPTATLPDSVKRMDQQALRKAPSTSTLMRGRQEGSVGSSASSGAAVKLPARARSNTSGDNKDVGEESGRSSPRMDVKSIIALYGQKGGKPQQSTESDDKEAYMQPEMPPSVPKRPSVTSITTKEAQPPPTPPPRSNAAPLLPPRLPRTSGLSSGVAHNDTGSSSNSTQSSSNGNGLSYVARKATAVPPTISGSPLLPARVSANRSTDDLGLPSRSRNNSSNGSSVAPQSRSTIGSGPKWASTSSGNLHARKPDVSADGRTATPPPPPPRHRASSSIGSVTTTDANGAATSQSASPRPTPRTPTSSQRVAASTASRFGSSTTTAVAAVESLAPPPRHIDARRATTASGGRGAPSPLEFGQVRQRRARRTRRRDERGQMVYERSPSSAVIAQRYGNVFDQHATKASNGGDALVYRQIVIRIWRRSKLDARYLQQVWQAALIRSSAGDGTSLGLHRDAFIRAMCAIDEELARRTGRSVGTTV